MRKSSIFISAALTTFALLMIYAVVAAYHVDANIQESPTQVSVDSTTEIPTSTTEQTVLSPEAAAQVAAQVLGRTDLLSAESSSVNGENAYKITFISGDVVYVGLDGMILSIETVPQVVTVQIQPTKRPSNNNNSGGNNNSKNISGNHDSHEDRPEGGD